MSLREAILRHAITRLRTAAYRPGDELVSVRQADLRVVLAWLEIKPAPTHDAATCSAPICRDQRWRDA